MNVHWNNRGDEAANRALIDELQTNYKKLDIVVQINANTLFEVEKLEKQNVKVLKNRYPKSKHFLECLIILLTKGRITFTQAGREFVESVKSSDMVVHSPGGPSIGDVYQNAELAYLMKFLIVKRLGKPYFFYAPSMGPFQNNFRNICRKYILENATCICFREDISAKYFQELLPNKEFTVTLDSAFQNNINKESTDIQLHKYKELSEFMNSYKKIIGITITDLQWNPLYSGNTSLEANIRKTFEQIVKVYTKKGYGVLFIPQLFGAANDYNYMDSFGNDNTFTMSDTYDCYFQQYIISKIYAVIGMRYHSNIFSCKMGTPFISISYEQKMKGFMEKQNLSKYCIDVNELNEKIILETFELLETKYDEYQIQLSEMHLDLQKNSKRTTELLIKQLQIDYEE